MAVAFELRFAGATLEQYDGIVRRMGFTEGGKGAEGGLFHWVAKTEDGIRVVDVWQSAEHFERFAKETMRPLVQEAGITTEPEISSFPVHNYLTAG